MSGFSTPVHQSMKVARRDGGACIVEDRRGPSRLNVSTILPELKGFRIWPGACAGVATPDALAELPSYGRESHPQWQSKEHRSS
jgi:hypothetical protein